MIRTKRIAMLIFAAFSGATTVLAARTAPTAAFAPGKWDHYTHLLTAQVPGVPQWLIKLTASHSHRTSCDSRAELTNHAELLFKADDSAVCKMRRLSMENGKIVFDTMCTNKHFPDGLLVASRGTYTPTTYTLATIATGQRNGKPVRITTHETGERVSGTCDA